MTRATEEPLDPSPTDADGSRPAATARTDGAGTDRSAGTSRDRAKAQRRAALLAAAARLFAERGFDGVTLGDIGEAAGVSGPAVYRHVAGKQALLGAILVDVSERLLEGGRRVAGRTASDEPAKLIADTPFHHAPDPRTTADLPTTAPPPTDRPADPAAHAPFHHAPDPRTTADLPTTKSPDGALRALVDFHVAFALAEADVIRVQDRDLDRLSPDDRRTVRDLQNAYVGVWTEALAAAHPDAETPAERRVRALACFGLINSTPHSVRGTPASRVRPTLTRMALAALSA